MDAPVGRSLSGVDDDAGEASGDDSSAEGLRSSDDDEEVEAGVGAGSADASCTLTRSGVAAGLTGSAASLAGAAAAFLLLVFSKPAFAPAPPASSVLLAVKVRFGPSSDRAEAGFAATAAGAFSLSASGAAVGAAVGTTAACALFRVLRDDRSMACESERGRAQRRNERCEREQWSSVHYTLSSGRAATARNSAQRLGTHEQPHEQPANAGKTAKRTPCTG